MTITITFVKSLDNLKELIEILSRSLYVAGLYGVKLNVIVNGKLHTLTLTNRELEEVKS